MDRPDFWPAAEHNIDGTPLLVGMGLLDCLGWVGGAAPLSVGDLRWRKPAICGPGCRVALLTRQEGDSLTVELHNSQPGAGHTENWSIAASARLTSMAAPPTHPAPLDVEALCKNLREAEPQPEPHTAPQNGPQLNVSGRWQCRERLWLSQDGNTLLARLCLPEAYRSDFNTFRWHPAMMDIAASLALHDVHGFVPAACKAARLYSAITPQVYALTRITDRQPGMITADCVVTDTAGQVLVELSGLVFMVLRQVADERPRPELYALGWENADLAPLSAGHTKIMLLGGQGGVLAPALKRALGSQVAAQGIWPVQADDARALANEVLDADIDHLLCLPDSPDAAQDNAWALCALLQEVCRGGARRPLRVTVVGGGAFVPDTPPDTLHQGPLHQGPLLCLPWEEPRISCAYVELEAPADAASAALALAAGLGRIDGPYVAAAEGAARVRTLVKLPSAPASGPGAGPVITGKGCVVITGGLGGMGRTLARQINGHCGARVVLLHRSGQLPPDMLAGESSGRPFTAYQCDVTDAAQVEAVFAAIRREVGPIQGVIHTAGVAGRGYLLTSRRQDYEAVLAPKVAGTWNLHKATLGDGLAFFVLASSRTALTGAPGQSDYTAANAYLNAFARYRRSLGLPALSICWNTWSGVGMAAREGLAQGPEASGMLDPQQAFEVLAAALASGEATVVVGMSGENAADFKLNNLPGQGRAAGQGGSAEAGESVLATGSASASSAASVSPSRAAANVGEAALLEIIRDCLGYDKPLSREDDFFDLGGDSIAATRIVNRLEKEAGLVLSVSDLLESDTLGDIVDRAQALQQPAQQKQKAVEATPALDRYPVGNEQLAILYADMVSEGDLGFNLPVFLVMPHDVDVARLQEALARLVERHEVLRTTFCDFEAERPAMVIHPFAGFELEQRRVADLARKDALIRPFDLRREGGFRACLLLTDAGERVLFLDVHHALGDGRTMSLLNVDLYRLYHGLPLEPVTAQMKDIAWRQVTHPDAEAAAYWQGIYSGELPRLDLPASYPRPRVHTGRGGMYEFELAPELVQGIKALARKEGLTNYQVSLCAWSLLAQAYTGSQDVVVAVSVDGRGEHLNTAGMLASVLPLRFSLDPARPLGEHLRATRQISNEAMRHRGYILNSLLADLRQTSWPDRSPLSEIILSYMNFEFAAEGQGLFETLRFSKHASKTDLSVFASDTGAGIGIALEYYADLFSEADVRRMASDYVRILELMTTSALDETLRFAPAPLPAADGDRAGLARHQTTVAASLRRAICTLAAQKGASHEAVMLAVFAVLVGRVTQRARLTIDVPPGRAVAFELNDSMEFDDLLAHTQAGLASGAAAAGSTEPSAAARPGLRLGFACTPLASTAPVASAAAVAGAGYACADSPLTDLPSAGYGLFCQVQEQGDGFALSFAYDPRQVSAETAGDWLEYYGRFLEGITQETA